MASSSSQACKYDVFLNFRGTDTREGFTSYLYEALRLAGINTFIDVKLERGEEISFSLLQEIESSSLYVVIFSQNYAFSPYCLDELVKIVGCKESRERSVFPIFYKVDPGDIEELRGSYEKAFAEHETKINQEKDKLEKWKSALRKVVSYAGWHITDDRDAPKSIKKIVLTISNKLNEEKKGILRRKLQELQAVEADLNSQLEKVESYSSERQSDGIGIWLTNVRRIKDDAQSIHEELEKSRWTMQFGGRVEIMIEEVSKLIDQKGGLEGALMLNASQTNDEFLPTKRMLGQKFRSNIDLILEWLSSDEVSSIGICGMGGVGKTTLVTHIHNKLLENPFIFSHVYWVTVSQDFSVYKLQSCIANTIKLDLNKEEDKRKRAGRLLNELNKRHKFVLILDDLWNHVDVTEVGIPIDKNGCKLMVTTRSVEVCNRTNCQKVEKIEPLIEEEAWNLFKETFGCKLSPNVEMIAKSIARECAGLPLAIVTMAGSMRGVKDFHEWKNALLELQSSRQDDMKEGVFRILRYSYNRLNDPALQQCLLYCALFPEDCAIRMKRLMEYLIVERIIDPERNTREEKLNKGYTMLNKLVYVSLLERVSEYHVKMHDLIRDMAIHIMKECQPSIVEVGKQLQYVPDDEYWRKDIVRVSLMNNEIEEIPPKFSPQCPSLSTLLLSENRQLVSLAGTFFDQLKELKVIDLSYTQIKKLPKSIAALKNIIALFIRSSPVRYIPSLANLKSMELLHLQRCYAIKKVPRGLESLSNLRYLNLFRSGIREFPGGILPKLSHLEFLAFHKPSKNVEELGGLRRLENLYWCFPTIGHLTSFLHLLSKMPTKQIKYTLCVGSELDFEFLGANHEVILKECAVTRELGELHFQLDSLSLINVTLEHGRGLCLQNPTGLKSLQIGNCSGIEYLFSKSTSPSIFQSLEKLSVCNMDNLKVLFSDLEMMVPLPPEPMHISSCSMKKLLPHCFLSEPQEWKKDEANNCQKLEEISSVEENSHTLPLSLPNLKQLRLINLPKLKSICSEKIKCDYLHSIHISDCKELKNVSISLPLPYLESVKASPREWWDSVKWGHPDQKDALPFVAAADWIMKLRAADMKAFEETARKENIVAES